MPRKRTQQPKKKRPSQKKPSSQPSKSRTASDSKQQAPAKQDAASTPTPPSGAKLWLFRTVLFFFVPALLIIGLETGLRLFGYGVPTAFTVEQEIDGEKRILSNPYFVWRFLGPRVTATKGTHFSLPSTKPENTYRVFVLGASAAQGFPAPDFGMARMLDVMLKEQYPGADFEVVNAAIPAINSHVILPMIRDCSRMQADLFIIYLGNNEVVGPYGAGTVFSPLVSSLPVIRTGVALRSTRIGQLLSNTFKGVPALGQPRLEEFHGMATFVNHQVSAADPGMPVVYRHFEQNLRDICRVAQKEGIPVIVSTVGANLKDNAPFASLHRPGLSREDRRLWGELVREGAELRQQEQYEEAVKRFLSAETIDADHAELHFRLGRCYRALGDYIEAKSHYVRAMELDGLRFRADTRINEIIRSVAADRSGQGIHLVDSLQILEDSSPQQIPGNELFYEHVHMNYRGTYLVTLAILEQLQGLLPDWVIRNASNDPILSEDDCAQRLVFTGRSHLEIAMALLDMMDNAPFTDQLDNAAQKKTWSRKVEELEARNTSKTGRQDVLAQYEAAFKGSDIHYLTHVAYAGFQYGVLDNPEVAEKHLKIAADHCPQSIENLFFLSEVLTYQDKRKEAKAYLSRALNLARSTETPETYQAKKSISHRNQWKRLYEQAEELGKQGRYREGTDAAKQALSAAKPAFGRDHPNMAATLNSLAKLYQAQGKYAEAGPLFERSLEITKAALGEDHRNVAEALNNLAGLYRAQGNNAEAESLYQESLATAEKTLGKDDPNVAGIQSNLAGLYRIQRKYAEAEDLYRQSLAVLENALGSRHPTVASMMNNLAGVCQDQRKYPEAEFLYKRSLAALERVLGRNHPNTATVLENLAKCSEDMGKAEEARMYGERARQIRSKR